MYLDTEALNMNSIWDLDLLPNGRILVGCTWVYIVKYKVMDLLKDTSQDW